MKLMFASDIHGNAYFCNKLKEAYNKEQPEKLILLGDLLYNKSLLSFGRNNERQKTAGILNDLMDYIIAVPGSFRSAFQRRRFKNGILRSRVPINVFVADEFARILLAAHTSDRHTFGTAYPALFPDGFGLHRKRMMSTFPFSFGPLAACIIQVQLIITDTGCVMRLFGNGCRITVHIHAQAFSHVIACWGRAVLGHIYLVEKKKKKINCYTLLTDCTSIVKDVFAQAGIASSIRIVGIVSAGCVIDGVSIGHREYIDQIL